MRKSNLRPSVCRSVSSTYFWTTLPRIRSARSRISPSRRCKTMPTPRQASGAFKTQTLRRPSAAKCGEDRRRRKHTSAHFFRSPSSTFSKAARANSNSTRVAGDSSSASAARARPTVQGRSWCFFASFWTDLTPMARSESPRCADVGRFGLTGFGLTGKGTLFFCAATDAATAATPRAATSSGFRPSARSAAYSRTSAHSKTVSAGSPAPRSLCSARRASTAFKASCMTRSKTTTLRATSCTQQPATVLRIASAAVSRKSSMKASLETASSNS
mmetsp:Transcript_22257/g.77121  ORF Transcript_22257/g.77121 Transcript_22257/m.77121 type:complete len:273 (-) Transcript_22257:262-1080(-)